MKKLILVCAMALASGNAAWANVIPTGTGITGSGPYVWTYDLSLASDQNVNSGTAPTVNPVPRNILGAGGFFTIYDFAGYVGGSCTGPTGWTCTAQDLGFTPSDVLPNDSAAIVNLTWAYTSGPTLLGQPNGRELGTFSATSIFNTAAFVSYAGRGSKNNGNSSGTTTDNVGTTQGPTSVPLPGSLALSAAGLLILGLIRKVIKPKSELHLPA